MASTREHWGTWPLDNAQQRRVGSEVVGATECTIRRARLGDAGAIASLMAPYAAIGLVLPRSEIEIKAHVGEFLVACREERVCGCVALRDYGDGLMEIRSLIVAEEYSGAGLGSRLVESAVENARTAGNERIFALTMRPHLFIRLGFHVVNKERFPQKVWTDCARCRKRENCDEIAVLFQPDQDER